MGHVLRENQFTLHVLLFLFSVEFSDYALFPNGTTKHILYAVIHSRLDCIPISMATVAEARGCGFRSSLPTQNDIKHLLFKHNTLFIRRMRLMKEDVVQYFYMMRRFTE